MPYRGLKSMICYCTDRSKVEVLQSITSFSFLMMGAFQTYRAAERYFLMTRVYYKTLIL